jgi:hypothetical protein
MATGGAVMQPHNNMTGIIAATVFMMRLLDACIDKRLPDGKSTLVVIEFDPQAYHSAGLLRGIPMPTSNPWVVTGLGVRIK